MAKQTAKRNFAYERLIAHLQSISSSKEQCYHCSPTGGGLCFRCSSEYHIDRLREEAHEEAYQLDDEEISPYFSDPQTVFLYELADRGLFSFFRDRPREWRTV